MVTYHDLFTATPTAWGSVATDFLAAAKQCEQTVANITSNGTVPLAQLWASAAADSAQAKLAAIGIEAQKQAVRMNKYGTAISTFEEAISQAQATVDSTVSWLKTSKLTVTDLGKVELPPTYDSVDYQSLKIMQEEGQHTLDTAVKEATEADKTCAIALNQATDAAEHEMPPPPPTDGIHNDEDYKYNSKSGGISGLFRKGGSAGSKAEMYAVIAKWKLQGQNEAARGMEHYLDQTGTDFIVPANKVDEWAADATTHATETGTMAGTSPAQALQSAINKKIEYYADEAKRIGQDVPISDTTLWHLVANGNGDAYNLLGHYQISASMTGVVHPDGTYDIKYQPHVFDYYNYGGHNSIGLSPSSGVMNDAHKLYEDGWAKDFITKGSGTIHQLHGKKIG